MDASSYTSEYQVEEKFIHKMTTNWYKRSNVKDQEALENNFRDKLNLLNKKVLNGTKISDDEFQLILDIFNKKSIFEISQILRTGIIDEIKRGGKPLYLKLVDFEDISKNNFEVANQIKSNGKYNGRFDVTLLINGIPFVQIELKKPGVEINEAFNQVIRYKREQNYRGLFKGVQLFVISNEQNTRYFANNNEWQDIKPSDAFVWTTIDNKPVNYLYDFEETFLFCPTIFSIVFDYMIDSAKEKKLYVMRPYQIFAFNALKKQVDKDENGYCFHSTGSGKTMTSFKFAYEMSKRADVDKVFFLVDRKDLDEKTTQDFNSFMSSPMDLMSDVASTYTLINKMNSNEKLIISTINKMSNALSERYQSKLKALKNKKIIFVFDECHRSQSGSMRKNIEKYFKNALYYGFTGTPIFDSEDEKNEHTKLTSLYFGKPVHTYTMKEAIGDRNVLPLCIDYVKTLKIKDDTYLLDKQVEGIDYEQALLSDKRIQMVADNILKTYDQKTNNREYNAMLACQSIELAVKYYDILSKTDLRVATIYSYKANEDLQEKDVEKTAKDDLARIIKEYNERPENKTNFDLSTYAEYESDVITKFTNRELDLLIVVNKCLTGMNFKRCNTLYLDKTMKMHGLIQAFSRTIRTYSPSKKCGNIVCYQTSRKNVDEALAHFNNDVDVYNDVTIEPLDKLMNKFNFAFLDCKDNIELANSKSEKDRAEYVKKFRNLMRIFTEINNYSDFDINNSKANMEDYYKMQSYYKDIYNETKTTVVKDSILNDIDYEVQLLSRVNVNFDYIVELLLKFNESDSDKERKRLRSKTLQTVNEIKDKQKRDLIIKFVESFMDEDIPGLYDNVDPSAQYAQFIKIERTKEIKKISERYSIDMKPLEQYIDSYNFNHDMTDLKSKITNGIISKDRTAGMNDKDKVKFIKESLSNVDAVALDIKKISDKFDDITAY